MLKIDVDGSEEDVLNGAKKTLKKNMIKIIFLEIGAQKKYYNNKEKKMINFLEKRNFKFVKKYMMLPTSLFSGIKYGDYLFFNRKFY